MNYNLIMTEGTDEKAFLDVLLDKGMLKFNKEELLFETIFHKRKLDTELVAYIQQVSNDTKIIIYRVGDKLSDKLSIPKEIKLYMQDKITKIKDIIISPEFEILFIINEGLYKDYEKVKSKYKPSEFYKRINKDYNKQASFVKDYFNKMSKEEINELLKEFLSKRKRTIGKDKYTIEEIVNCIF